MSDSSDMNKQQVGASAGEAVAGAGEPTAAHTVPASKAGALESTDAQAATSQTAEGHVVSESADSSKTISIFGHSVKQADVFKLAGLLAFFVVVGIIVAVLYPSFSGLFEEGGVERTIEKIQSQGAFGVLTLLLMQFLQIVVAFIPGEVVQIASGMLYGPIWGCVVILIGCVISSGFIYMLVHKLGAPFVQDMIGEKNLAKARAFEESGKLSVLVFILFLIPGMPKDTFTYLVPLTNMKLVPFLVISNTARIPGILITTFAAGGLADGNYTQSIIIFAIAAVIAIIGMLGYRWYSKKKGI